MERIMNEENDWDSNAAGDAVEGPVFCVSRKEVLLALNEIKQEEFLDLQKYQWRCLLQSSRN